MVIYYPLLITALNETEEEMPTCEKLEVSIVIVLLDILKVTKLSVEYVVPNITSVHV